MKARVQKVGDGLALLLPTAITDQTDLAAGAEVDVTLENGAVVARLPAWPRYRLEDLVAQITDENRHPEIDTGPAVGREIW